MKIINLLLVLILILAGCSPKDQEMRDVSLMLDYTPNTNHIGVYVAKELGYYSDNNIELEILQPAGISVESMVANQSVDFGVSYQENVMMARDNGVMVTSIMSILPINTSGFYTYASHDNNADLTYCGWGTEVEYAILDYVLMQNGIDPNSVDKVVSDMSLLTSEDSECDIFWEYENWGALIAEQNNIVTNYYPLYENGLNWYTPVFITANQDQELIADFVEATIDGYIYAFKNIDQAADIFIKYNPEYEVDFIRQSLNQMNEVVDLNNFGYQEDKIWQDFANFLYENDIISSNDIKGAYSNEYID